MARTLEDLHEVARVENFRSYIASSEGNYDAVYKDSLGNLTVGIGHLLPSDGPLKEGDRITPAQKEAFWQADAKRALDAAEGQMRSAGISDPDFLIPLASVNFQLGSRWYKVHKHTWDLIKGGDYAAAAKEAANSKWYKDSPKRVAAFQKALIQLERTEQARRQHQQNSSGRTR